MTGESLVTTPLFMGRGEVARLWRKSAANQICKIGPTLSGSDLNHLMWVRSGIFDWLQIWGGCASLPEAAERVDCPSLKGVVFISLRVVCRVAIGIAGATQLVCASVEATQLGMDIGSAPEGANLGTSAEAPESGNG